MQNECGLTPAERELEAALQRLRPAQASANRDRVMFMAGQGSVRRQRRIWQGVSICPTVMLTASILSRPPLRTVEVTTQYAADTAQDVREAISVSDLLAPAERKSLEMFMDSIRMRRAVLYRGIEALPTSNVERSAAGELRMTSENLEEMFGSI